MAFNASRQICIVEDASQARGARGRGLTWLARPADPIPGRGTRARKASVTVVPAEDLRFPIPPGPSTDQRHYETAGSSLVRSRRAC